MLLNFEKGSHLHGPHPETRVPLVLGVVLPLHILALMFVSARILVNSRVRKLGADDFLIIAAAFFAIGVMICTVITCKYGFAMHTRDFQPENQLIYGKLFYSAVVFGHTCYICTKVSMVFFYLRFASRPKFRKMCYISMVYIGLSTGAALFVNSFGCSPVKGSWDRSIPSKCITTTAFLYWSGINNIGTDLLLMVIPIPILANLQMKLRVKLGLLAMFSMGFLIIGVSATSLYMLGVSVYSKDILWDGSITWMWVLVELNIGIMTSCMPGVKLFFKWARGDSTAPKTLTPGSTRDKNVTIGSAGGKRKPFQDDATLSTISDKRASMDCETTGMGGIMKSTEVLLETGPAPGSRGNINAMNKSAW